MNLHNEIMDIQTDMDTNDRLSSYYMYGQEHNHTSYKIGHRDARHAAAELAIKYDALINELFDELENRHADDVVEKIKNKYGL